MSAVDIHELQSWIGRTETREALIAPAPVAALSACLDYEQPRVLIGETLPVCWHWLYFQDAVAASALGVDGHPQRGHFLPPVSLPRRMWAGSRLTFVSPLIVGEGVRRVSTITDIRHKQGRSGELVFLTLQHQLYAGDELALEEEQDLVYREQGSGELAKPLAAPAVAQWSREIRPDSVLLFRYSALTFNSHRIHYDCEYAVGVEGYSALVVQGPLTATLLLDLLYRENPEARIAAFEFSAVRPLYEGAVFKLQGRRVGGEVLLWALDDGDALAMEAVVRLAPG
jgi:3-methylfumaryl-CoA hydratase